MGYPLIITPPVTQSRLDDTVPRGCSLHLFGVCVTGRVVACSTGFPCNSCIKRTLRHCHDGRLLRTS